MSVLWINGVAMPDPSKITVSKNPIWSENTGRSSTGLLIGDLVCYKYKLQIEWSVLSQEQSAKLDGAIMSSAFFTVKFIDPADSSGGFISKTMYTNEPSYPVYSYVNGFPRYKGVAVNLIEQ